MLGRKSCTTVKRRRKYKSEVDRFGISSGAGVFLLTIPNDAVIKDIMLYRPYTRGETITVKIFDDSNLLSTYDLLTNKLSSINLKVGGLVPCTVASETIEKIVVFYEI